MYKGFLVVMMALYGAYASAAAWPVDPNVAFRNSIMNELHRGNIKSVRELAKNFLRQHSWVKGSRRKLSPEEKIDARVALEMYRKIEDFVREYEQEQAQARAVEVRPGVVIPRLQVVHAEKLRNPDESRY